MSPSSSSKRKKGDTNSNVQQPSPSISRKKSRSTKTVSKTNKSQQHDLVEQHILTKMRYRLRYIKDEIIETSKKEGNGKGKTDFFSENSNNIENISQEEFLLYASSSCDSGAVMMIPPRVSTKYLHTRSSTRFIQTILKSLIDEKGLVEYNSTTKCYRLTELGKKQQLQPQPYDDHDERHNDDGKKIEERTPSSPSSSDTRKKDDDDAVKGNASNKSMSINHCTTTKIPSSNTDAGPSSMMEEDSIGVCKKKVLQEQQKSFVTSCNPKKVKAKDKKKNTATTKYYPSSSSYDSAVGATDFIDDTVPSQIVVLFDTAAEADGNTNDSNSNDDDDNDEDGTSNENKSSTFSDIGPSTESCSSWY